MSTLASRGLKYKYSEFSGTVTWPGGGPNTVSSTIYQHAAEDKLLYTILQPMDYSTNVGGTASIHRSMVVTGVIPSTTGEAIASAGAPGPQFSGTATGQMTSWIQNDTQVRASLRTCGMDGAPAAPYVVSHNPNASSDTTLEATSPFAVLMPGDKVILSVTLGTFTGKFRLIKIYSA